MADSPIPTKLLWVDLEMTGLNPDKDRIIEVAAIVSDWDFKELQSFQAVIKQDTKLLERMDEWNKTTHGKSGLLKEIPGGISEAEAEDKLVGLIEQTFGEEPVVLAGNSIYFDRRFIRRYWPKVEAKLHYRMLDVTAWKVVMQGKFNHVFESKDAHRALDDIRESIAELQDYLAYFQRG